MSWFSRCSWCGGPFNGGNCRHCTNVSFGDKFVNNPEPNFNKTPNFSYPPSQFQTSSLEQWHCFHCKDPLERGEHCKRCSCKWCGSGLSDGFCFICASSNENSSNNDLNPNSFNNPPNDFTHPPQPQYETYLCELCGNNSHHGYDYPPQFPFVYEQEPCYNQNYDDNYSHNSSSFLCCNCGGSHQAAQSFTPYWNFPIIDDDDDEYTIQYREYLENLSNAITPELPTEEPDNSLSMGDEYLDTIPETESDEVIKSSVDDLVPIPSEFEGIFDNTCDVPSCDKKHFDAETDLMESLLNRDTLIVYSPKIDSLLEEFAGELAPINPIPSGIHEADFDPKEDIRLDDQLLYDDYASSDDDTFYSEDIDYVEASPPDSELVSLEEVKNFDTEDGEIDTDILLTIKDDILREKLQNINLLIAKIESLNDNPTPDFVLKSHSSFPIPVKDSDFFLEKSKTFLSLPEPKTFRFDIKEKNSGSTTVHADISLSEYDSFHFEIEPDQGELTRVVMEDISDNSSRELYVHVPNILPILPILVDHLYLFLTYVIRLFLPYFTYPVESPFLFSSRSEDTIFDPGIFDFHFSSLEPTASQRSGTFICFIVYPNILNESPMEICSSTCVVPNITMISGESS
ncbi:hypothetical protein Tco_0231207 [Tanacetum coccineum]